MNILAIDTAMEACSAALLSDGVLRERYAVCPREHNERILPMVDELLAESGLAIGDIELLAFGRGPGAFTGVRIAVGVVQGLALSNDIPVIGVSDLAAIALRAGKAHQANQVLVLTDARMGEVYAGRFLVHGDCVEPDGPEIVSAPDAVAAPSRTGWLAAGSGWNAYRDSLSHLGDFIVGFEPDCLPRASEIAKLAAGRPAGEATAASMAAPVYLRDRVAEPASG